MTVAAKGEHREKWSPDGPRWTSDRREERGGEMMKGTESKREQEDDIINELPVRGSICWLPTCPASGCEGGLSGVSRALDSSD